MKLQISEALYPRLVIAGGAAVLLGGFGIAAMLAWSGAPSDADGAPEDASPVSAAARVDARVRTKCADCGIVESTRDTREISPASEAGAGPDGREASAAGRYEVSVRMRDGTRRVFLDANPANWQAGERVSFIAGASPASD